MKQTKTSRQPPESVSSSFVSSDFVQQATSGTGLALPSALRDHLEPSFGHNFANVRVFHDDQAADSAAALGAKAFTFGQDIVFGAGRYQPDAPQGLRLLTHELTHTIQQGTASSGADRYALGQSGDAFERQASATSSAVMSGRGVAAIAKSAPTIQCEDEREEAPPEAVKPDLNFNLAKLQAAGVMPIGEGAGAAQVSPDGVYGQLKQPQFNLSAGLKNWSAPFADGDAHIGDLTAQAHLDPDQARLALQHPVGDGTASFEAKKDDGGFDLRALYSGKSTQAFLGTAGAGIARQQGPFDFKASTDYKRAEGSVDYTGKLLEQQYRLSLGAGIGLDGNDPEARLRATLLQPGGLPLNPFLQGGVNGQGLGGTAGLGLPFDETKFFQK